MNSINEMTDSQLWDALEKAEQKKDFALEQQILKEMKSRDLI